MREDKGGKKDEIRKEGKIIDKKRRNETMKNVKIMRRDWTTSQVKEKKRPHNERQK